MTPDALVASFTPPHFIGMSARAPWAAHRPTDRPRAPAKSTSHQMEARGASRGRRGRGSRVLSSCAMVTDTRPLAVFTQRKIRRYPRNFGNATLFEGVCAASLLSDPIPRPREDQPDEQDARRREVGGRGSGADQADQGHLGGRIQSRSTTGSSRTMLRDGTLLELNQKTYPGCYLHRSHPQDVARTEQLTFICTRDKDDAGPTNNWMAPPRPRPRPAPTSRTA